MDFCESTDESLIQYVQAGNDRFGSAFSELMSRYTHGIDSRARKNHGRFPRVSIEDFRSYHMEHFWEAVRKFDINNPKGVSFRVYADFKLTKRTFDIIRSKLYERSSYDAERMIEKTELPTVSLDNTTDDGVMAESVADPSADYETRRSITSTDLFRYLRKQSQLDARFVRLLDQGYSYAEIGKRLGHTGADPKSWGKRVVARVRQTTVQYYVESRSVHELRDYLKAGVSI